MSEWEQRRAWLEGVKAGDQVVYAHGWSGDDLRTIDKTTRTTITIGGLVFRRADGYLRGDKGYRRGMIREPTVRSVEAIQCRKGVERLARSRWSEVSPQKIAEIIAILDTPEEP